MQRQRRLEPIAAEHDRVDQALMEATQMLEQSRSINFAIAKALADVRSSSAVLAEVRRLVPESIVLNRLVLDGNALEISGSAEQPNGLRLVNALMLRLSSSGFFSPRRVELSNANVPGQAEKTQLQFIARGLRPMHHWRRAPSYVLCGGNGPPHGDFGAGGFVEVTNFQAEPNRRIAVWLTPERSVAVVPIIAGLALAAMLASAVITPQIVQLRQRRAVVDVLDKEHALPAWSKLFLSVVWSRQRWLSSSLSLDCWVRGSGDVPGAAQCISG